MPPRRPGTGRGREADRVLDGLGARCDAALREHGCPSVSVAVAVRDEVVLARAYGTACTRTGAPATPETAYCVASVTKPFTATAVLLAAEEGLLPLDAPPPGAVGDAAPTVRQLLRHEGGLETHYDFRYDGEPPLDPRPYAVPRRPPGTGFRYANTGYGLLGDALERVTGKPLETVVRERVCAPLGLTGFRLGRTGAGPGPVAARYTVDGRAYPAHGTSHPAASLGWITAPELALFARGAGRLLRPATAAAVTARPARVNGHLGYGLGWCVSTGSGPVVLSHGGGMGGVAAMVAHVPEREVAVAVLTNSTAKGARDAVLAHVLGALVPGHGVGRLSPAADDPERSPVPGAGTWAGHALTPQGPVEVGLRLTADGRATVTAGGAEATGTVRASACYDVRVAVPLQFPTADARVNSPDLELELRCEGGRLTGVARAFKQDGDARGLLGSLLSHPCELAPR
jgi:CubicO group peptidase (beta-lactamase class C family)